MKKPPFIVRTPRSGDYEAMAFLATQLGYQSNAVDIERRVAAMRDESKFAVYVAEDETGAVIGWISAFVYVAVAVDACAEINGLVVARDARSCGAGTELLNAVEAWARGLDLVSVCVRSNVLRERAHHFYRRHGYEPTKDQRVFSKSWERSEGP